MNLPRGIRNNNPGNVRLSDDAWQGEVHPGTDKSFIQFDTMTNGVRCTAKILLGYQTRGFHTVRGMVNRWAPPTENDTDAYVKAVAAECSVDPDGMIALGPTMLRLMCIAIFRHENGGDFVSGADLTDGVNAALR